MREIGMEYDEAKAIGLCKKAKETALANCETEDERSAVKDMTIGKLEDMGFLYRNGSNLAPTHVFMLMTDNWSRFAKIQCALFKGTERDIFIDKKEFDGPIDEQLSDVFSFILRHINTGAKVDGLYRKDVYELPIKSIRELIANAIIHRSYMIESKIQVSMFDDRIEVVSPGMLYGGIDLEAMKSGRSKCRNQAIADIFQYMHIVEAWGTGVPRIIASCKHYGLRPPSFEEFGDGIKATIYRTQADKQIEKQADRKTSRQADKQINGQKNNQIEKQADKQTSEQADKRTRKRTSRHIDDIRKYLENVEDASAAEIADTIGLSPARTRAILSEMGNEIEAIGATNRRRYKKITK